LLQSNALTIVSRPRTQSKDDACNTKRKPPKLKQDEPVDPDVYTAICLKLSDDGQLIVQAIASMFKEGRRWSSADKTMQIVRVATSD
jgi:hypothetical protein